jgi:hypothetical protein
MLQGGNRMVLGAEDGVLPIEVPLFKGPGTQKLSRPTGYSASVTGSDEKGRFPQIPSGLSNSDPTVRRTSQLEPPKLFVGESQYRALWDQFPHTIAEIYASAKKRRCVWSFGPHSFSLKVCPGRWLVVPLATDMNGYLLSSISMRTGRVGNTRCHGKFSFSSTTTIPCISKNWTPTPWRVF